MNKRGKVVNNQTLISDEHADNRVDTEQILSHSMQVVGSRRYTTNAAVQSKKGKGYDDFDYVADNSDSKSEAGGSQTLDTGTFENGKRPAPINLRRMASETPSMFSAE